MIKNPHEGKFIVFEGLDGSGKSTQAEYLVKKLKQDAAKFHKTFEPTQYLIGGLIRSFLGNDWKSSADCLQLLFAADRAYHLEKEIFPALEKKLIVVSDRYFFSSFAYGALDCDFFEQIAKLEKVWQNYEKIISRFRIDTDIRVIDGDRPIQDIFEDVENILAKKDKDGWKT
ncbi:MAG: dTMP kinase [Candidatus Nealsonbacteria bacterium]|nr:dTMP kinase [Candidatus Nealsonbacteria bacterium]